MKGYVYEYACCGCYQYSFTLFIIDGVNMLGGKKVQMLQLEMQE